MYFIVIYVIGDLNMNIKIKYFDKTIYRYIALLLIPNK